MLCDGAILSNEDDDGDDDGVGVGDGSGSITAEEEVTFSQSKNIDTNLINELFGNVQSHG